MSKIRIRIYTNKGMHILSIIHPMRERFDAWYDPKRREWGGMTFKDANYRHVNSFDARYMVENRLSVLFPQCSTDAQIRRVLTQLVADNRQQRSEGLLRYVPSSPRGQLWERARQLLSVP